MGELTQFSPRLQPLLSVILVPHSLLKRDLLLKKSSSNPTFNFLPFARRRTSRRALLWGAVKPKPFPSFSYHYLLQDSTNRFSFIIFLHACSNCLCSTLHNNITYIQIYIQLTTFIKCIFPIHTSCYCNK